MPTTVGGSSLKCETHSSVHSGSKNRGPAARAEIDSRRLPEGRDEREARASQHYDPRFQREAIAPIQNKLGQFLQNPVIRNILGQVRNKVSNNRVRAIKPFYAASRTSAKTESEPTNPAPNPSLRRRM